MTGSQEMMSWGMILFHVVIVSFLSNIGKLCPMFFYRDRKLSERLALSIGMFTRGEVGAGIILLHWVIISAVRHWSFRTYIGVESYSDRNICPLGENLALR